MKTLALNDFTVFKETITLDAPQFYNPFENIKPQNYDMNYSDYNTNYSLNCSDQNEIENSDYHNNTKTNNYLDQNENFLITVIEDNET